MGSHSSSQPRLAQLPLDSRRAEQHLCQRISEPKLERYRDCLTEIRALGSKDHLAFFVLIWPCLAHLHQLPKDCTCCPAAASVLLVLSWTAAFGFSSTSGMKAKLPPCPGLKLRAPGPDAELWRVKSGLSHLSGLSQLCLQGLALLLLQPVAPVSPGSD